MGSWGMILSRHLILTSWLLRVCFSGVAMCLRRCVAHRWPRCLLVSMRIRTVSPAMILRRPQPIRRTRPRRGSTCASFSSRTLIGREHCLSGLAKKGYVSHQSGKYWEGSHKRAGFTEGMTLGYPNKGGRHGDAGLKIGREGMAPVLKFIDRSVAAEKPFFVWYAPFLPHTPHNPPARLLEKYSAKGHPRSIAKYYAMCEWFDETCGTLIKHIDDRGIADQTLVIYVTDNGWIQLPDRGGLCASIKAQPLRRGNPDADPVSLARHAGSGRSAGTLFLH